MNHHPSRSLLIALALLIALVACQTAPAPSPTAIPATPTSIVAQTFSVLADQGWQRIGYVRLGQQFELTATGSWRHRPDEAPSSPAGKNAFDPGAMLPSAPLGALIGRIGENPPFLVGEHALMTAPFGGELSLSMNDRPESLSDNSGALDVALAWGAGSATQMQLLTNHYGGYLTAYPSEYHAIVYQDEICLTLAEATELACHVANAFIRVSRAEGRTLSQVADEEAAYTNPSIPVRRTSMTVSGVEAIRLDDIHGVDTLRKVVIVHDDRAYVLTFLPWREELEDFARIETLYSTMIKTLTLLSPPPTPPLTSPANPPLPDLSTMQVSTRSSTSPDGSWKAEALLAFFTGEIYAFDDYTRLTVTRGSDNLWWMPYEEWTEGGLGDTFLSDFYWSPEGRYLYFTHRGSTHPCGYPFATNLHRVDLEDGSLLEIPLTGLLLGDISISPDVSKVAYRTEGGILVYDFKDGTSRVLDYPWPPGFGFIVGGYAWSPDGKELGFTLTEPLCDSPEPPSDTVTILDHETGQSRAPAPADTWLYLPARVSADPIPTAALVLRDFMDALYWGGRGGEGDLSYERAAALYGGSYEVLIEMNPDLDPTDGTALLRNACEVNGFPCLRLREVIFSQSWVAEDGARMVYFAVHLTDHEGGIFALWPGDGAWTGRPEILFSFTLRQFEDGLFRVLELPPFVP